MGYVKYKKINRNFKAPLVIQITQKDECSNEAIESPYYKYDDNNKYI